MFGALTFAGAPFAGVVVLSASLLRGDATITITAAGTLSVPGTITIGGVDVRGRVRVAGLVIRDILNDAPNTCTLTLEGDGPAIGQRLRITLTDGSRVLFAGTVQTVDQAFEGRPDHLAWHVTAIDDTARANARRPFGTWIDTSATTIAREMAAAFVPDFSTAGIEAGLPPVSIVFDGSETVIGCLARLATAVGGYCKIEDGILYLFTDDPTDPPDPIDDAHPFLFNPPIQVNTDASQLRTRVYGKGYGEHIVADLAIGETLIPIQDGVNFPRLGGTAIAALTADGAQSDRVTFAGVELAGGGTLVGPGAAPGAAPTLALQGGAGVTAGPHTVSVVYVTALGKTLAGPPGAITAGVHAPPDDAPAAGAPLTGTGPDQGSHDYTVSFVTGYGETTAGAISNAITTSAAAGQLPAPTGNLGLDLNGPHAGNVEIGFHIYRVTFVNSQGETELGTQTSGTTQVMGGPGQMVPIVGPTVGGTGGNLTPGKRYFYIAVYYTANGETTGNMGPHDIDETLTAGQNAITVNGLPTGTELGAAQSNVIGRKIYRHEETSNGSWSGGPWFLVATIANLGATTYVDTVAQASAATGPSRTFNNLSNVSTAGPRTIPVSLIPIGPAGTTARRIYRGRVNVSDPTQVFLAGTLNNNTATTFSDAGADASLGALGPSSNTTGTAVQRVPLTNIPVGPISVTARKLYRRFNGAGTFKLVTTIANNTGTSYTDSTPNSGLGAAALTVATAIGHQILVGLPKGAQAVTAREVYMSPTDNQAFRLRVATIPDNTTATVTITTPDTGLLGQPTEPIADTSGLAQPQGQVNPGSTVLPLAAAATFKPGGGWVSLAGGQTVRYQGINAQTLIGIPPTGAGAITTTVLYGSQAIPAPMLVGVTGVVHAILKGSAIHIWVQRDDLLAQAEEAARSGGDGVIEYLLVDARRTVDSLTDRCDADLAMFARPLVTVAYATRDLKTKSGKTVVIDLPSQRLAATLTIQEVTITEIDLAKGLPPRFSVKASSVRFSLEDTLRRLIAGGQVVGGST